MEPEAFSIGGQAIRDDFGAAFGSDFGQSTNHVAEASQNRR